MIGALEERLKRFANLPNLKEFHVRASKVAQFNKARQKQMNVAFETASKDSIWRQLASQVVLRGGLRTFQRIEGHYTAPMELKSSSHSIAIPFSDRSDPVGATRKLLFLRTATKDTP